METELEMCDSCQRVATNSKATVFCFQCSERLCDQCDNHHKRNKASSNHKTQKLEDVKDLKAFETLTELTKCSVHVEKNIKYLCKDHDQLCCNECAIVRHRKCENVVSLAEEMEMSTKRKTPPTEDILKGLNKYADTLLLHENTAQTELEKTEEACTKALETFRKNMETAYQNLKDKITAESKTNREQITKSISNQKDEIEKFKENLKRSIQKLDTVKQVGQDLHVYITRREISLQLKTLENEMKNLRKTANSDEQVIKESSSIQTLQACFEKFIAVVVKKTNVALPVCDIKGLHVLRQEKVREYPLKLESLKQEKETYMYHKRKQTFKTKEKQTEQINGCTWLDRYLIVSQENNGGVLIDISGKPELISGNLELANSHLVTTIDSMRIAAVTPEPYGEYTTIYLYRINNEQRKLERISKVLAVRENIVGITHDTGLQAIVVLTNRCFVEFYSLDGKKIESFMLGKMERHLRSAGYRKCLILFDSNSKILYCTCNSTLIATTVDDRLVFEYKLPESVLGPPAMDVEGNIYYPIREKGQAVIQIISPKGKLIHSFKVCSCAVSFVTICFNKTKDKLALLCDEEDKELKIFDIRA